jgi:anti-anti-sigma regulatory factor
VPVERKGRDEEAPDRPTSPAKQLSIFPQSQKERTVGVALNQDGDSNLISFDGIVDIASAAELKAALLLAIEAGRTICVSLEKATSLDVTALQLIWAAEREARRLGVEFTRRGEVPESIRAGLASAGLMKISIFE